MTKKYALALFLVCFAANAFAQSEPEKLAVFVSGASEAGINKSFGSNLLAAIVQNSKYAEIVDSEAFYTELAENKGGMLQIAKQYGADFVCTVSMAEAFGAYSISARLIKTADSQITKTASLNRSIKSLDDLTKVSNELAGQLLELQIQEAAPSPIAVAPSPIAADPPLTVVVKKECESTQNINELVSKIQSGFPTQLKDCSASLAKNIALSKSPFGKKTELKEPKAFMMECTINGVKQKLLSGAEEYVKPVESFVQNIMSTASAADGSLDVQKLSSAIGGMNISGLLDEIKTLASGDACMVDEPYEPPAASASNDKVAASKDEKSVSEAAPVPTAGVVIGILLTSIFIGLFVAGVM